MKNNFLSDLPEDEREIAEYGLSQGLVLVGGLGLAVIVGWVMGIPLLAVSYIMMWNSFGLSPAGSRNTAGSPMSRKMKPRGICIFPSDLKKSRKIM